MLSIAQKKAEQFRAQFGFESAPDPAGQRPSSLGAQWGNAFDIKGNVQANADEAFAFGHETQLRRIAQADLYPRRAIHEKHAFAHNVGAFRTSKLIFDPSGLNASSKMHVISHQFEPGAKRLVQLGNLRPKKLKVYYLPNERPD